MKELKVLSEPVSGSKVMYPSKVSVLYECEDLVVPFTKTPEQALSNKIIQEMKEEIISGELSIYTLSKNELKRRLENVYKKDKIAKIV